MELTNLKTPLLEVSSIPVMVWFGRIVFVGLAKLSQSPKTKLPSLPRTRDVEFEAEEAFLKGEPLRRSSPLEVMTREAEPLTGELGFADHTTAFPGTLVNQTEKTKRFVDVRKNPAEKLEFRERSVRFWSGRHGESEILKEEKLRGFCCWEIEN